jgi:hypothetical protein
MSEFTNAKKRIERAEKRIEFAIEYRGKLGELSKPGVERIIRKMFIIKKRGSR